MQDIPNALPWLVLCGIPLSLALCAVYRAHRPKKHKEPPQIDTEAFRKFVEQEGRTPE